MNEAALRVSTAILFVLSHFVILILVVALYVKKGFTFEETTSTFAVIAPLFAGYTTLILKFIIDHQDDPPLPLGVSRKNYLFVFVSFMINVMFILAIVGLILMRAYNFGINNFEQFKIFLGIVEGAFAVYVGLILNSLFKTRAH